MKWLRFFRRHKEKEMASREVAKDRLKLLLVSDRAGCTPDIMEAIKNDLIHVISKYMEIDTKGLEIRITRTPAEHSSDTVPALYANIPIVNLRNVKG